jgi:hypothetical protein
MTSVSPGLLAFVLSLIAGMGTAVGKFRGVLSTYQHCIHVQCSVGGMLAVYLASRAARTQASTRRPSQTVLSSPRISPKTAPASAAEVAALMEAFAAGVMLCMSVFDILPEARHHLSNGTTFSCVRSKLNRPHSIRYMIFYTGLILTVLYWDGADVGIGATVSRHVDGIPGGTTSSRQR